MTTCADVKYKSGFESSAVCLVYVDITIKIMVRIPAWCRSHQEGKDTCQKFAEQSVDRGGAFIFPCAEQTVSWIAWKDEMSHISTYLRLKFEIE